MAYHQFRADADEEESWISEKVALATSKDTGDNMVSNQGMLKKYEAFEADLDFHRGQVGKMEASGKQLIAQVWARIAQQQCVVDVEHLACVSLCVPVARVTSKQRTLLREWQS